MEQAPKANTETINLFEKKFNILTDKGHNYEIILKSNNLSSIKFESIVKDDLTIYHYSSIFTIEKIKENKYFLMFDIIDEIINEINLLLEKNSPSIIEESEGIILKIPLNTSKIKEITFFINKKTKNNNEKIDELYLIISHLKNQINKELLFKLNEQNDEINKLKNIFNQQNNEMNNFRKIIEEQNKKIEILIQNSKEKKEKIFEDSIIIGNNENYKLTLLDKSK
jgi:leucyl aminopeptidase